MVDLNSLIPANSELYLFTACSINSRGEIIGLALDVQGNFHGYLATPSGENEDSRATFPERAGRRDLTTRGASFATTLVRSVVDC
jgi:hypothetical protein